MKTAFFGKITKVSIVLFAAVTLLGCGKKDGSSDESASEIITAGVSGVANQTESNGTVATYKVPTFSDTATAFLKSLLPIQSAYAASGQCPIVKLQTCDASGAVVLTYNDCYRGISTWNGSEKLQFSSLAVCQARTDVRGIPTSGSVVRTFDATASIGNQEVVLDSATASGYSISVSGGTSVVFSSDSNNIPMRTASILGIHLVEQNVSDGKIHWDHSLSTDSGNPLVISNTGANKEVKSGEVILQHNLAKFIGRATIESPLTFSAGCCHPTGGSIQTVFEGSKTGQETITFSASCGQATLTAVDGSQASIALRRCF